jgi:hypothetical protein
LRLHDYDNSKIATSKIIGPRQREWAVGFQQLVSHYLFRYHFCLIRRPNEKGVVEGLVKCARLNFMVPVPQIRDFGELNTYLLAMCRADMQRKLRGQTKIKEKLLLEEQFSFLPLIPFEACRIGGAKGTSLRASSPGVLGRVHSKAQRNFWRSHPTFSTYRS